MANVISFTILVVIGSLMRLLHQPQIIQVSFTIETTRSIHQTDDKFLSIAIDSGLIKKKWKNFDFNSERLQVLAKELSPAYLRIGGTEADYLIFDPDEITGSSTSEEFPEYIDVNHDWYANDNKIKPFENFTLSGRDWERINVFRKEVVWYLLFDVNALLRNGKKWDPTNAKKLLEYSARRGYQIDWQLGNEPIHYKNKNIGGSQLGKDYVTFRKLLNTFPHYKSSPLVGPDISHPRNATLKLLRTFLNKASMSVQAVTFHHYYLNGRTATLSQFIDPYYLDTFRIQIREFLNVVNRKKPRAKVWLTETSSAYGGGAPGLSDRYVAGFMWLDKLGMSAKEKLDIVVRQTFFHGHYALVDDNLDPTPDYWLSLLYKRLVGSKVLKVMDMKVSVPGGYKMRVYAHCTKTGPIYQHRGAVTVILMNLFNETVEVKVTDPELSSTHINQYLLTPFGANLTSDRVLLNDEELILGESNKIPKLNTTIIDTGKSFKMPAFSFGFYVWPRANVAPCKMAN